MHPNVSTLALPKTHTHTHTTPHTHAHTHTQDLKCKSENLYHTLAFVVYSNTLMGKRETKLWMR